jgi:hypothetical protein
MPSAHGARDAVAEAETGSNISMVTQHIRSLEICIGIVADG